MGRLIVIIAGMLGVLSAGVPAWGQGGTLTATLGPPLMPATPAKPLVDVLYINGVRIQAVVTNLAAIMPRETPQAAAVRKATAEVAAINAAINAAITAGTLPMGTALATMTIQPNTIPLRDSNGKPIIDPVTKLPIVKPNNLAGFPTITLTGVTLLGDPMGFKPGAGQQLASNPTGEIGGAKLVFPKGGGGGTGAKGAMVHPGGTSGGRTAAVPRGSTRPGLAGRRLDGRRASRGTNGSTRRRSPSPWTRRSSRRRARS